MAALHSCSSTRSCAEFPPTPAWPLLAFSPLSQITRTTPVCSRALGEERQALHRQDCAPRGGVAPAPAGGALGLCAVLPYCMLLLSTCWRASGREEVSRLRQLEVRLLAFVTACMSGRFWNSLLRGCRACASWMRAVVELHVVGWHAPSRDTHGRKAARRLCNSDNQLQRFRCSPAHTTNEPTPLVSAREHAAVDAAVVEIQRFGYPTRHGNSMN